MGSKNNKQRPPEKSTLEAAKSVLIVGLSGSGKTVYMKKFHRGLNGRHDKRPGRCVVINGRELDFSSRHTTHVTFEAVRKKVKDAGIENCLPKECNMLIWDDLSCPEPPKVAFLRELLTRTKRHSQVNVLCAVHTVQGNKISGLLSQFDRVVFTRGLGNMDNFARFARHHAWDLYESGEWRNFFGTDNIQRKYMVYEAASRSLSYLRGDLSEFSENQMSHATASTKFVETFIQCGDREAALKLFAYLQKELGSEWLSGSTYEVCLEEGDTYKCCSILDILAIASTVDGDPTPLEAKIISVLAKKKNIPRSLIRNQNLHSLLHRVVKKKTKRRN